FRGHDRGARRLLLSLPYRPLPGRDRHAGSGVAPTAQSRRRGRARLQFPPYADAGVPDDGASVRQDKRAQPRARGPRRTDNGSLWDGHGAIGRHAAYGRTPGHDPILEHDPEAPTLPSPASDRKRGRGKGWGPFGKDHAQDKEPERDDDSKKNHPALSCKDNAQ